MEQTTLQITLQNSINLRHHGTIIEISTEKVEDTSNSPPQKRAKRHPEENSQQLEATTINAAKTDDNLIGAEQLYPTSNQENQMRQIISTQR